MCRFPRPNALMNPMQLWLLEFELRADNNPNALMDSSDTPQDSLCLSPMLNELRPRESSCASASALHTASSLCSHCFWKCSLPHAVSTTESGLFSDLYRQRARRLQSSIIGCRSRFLLQWNPQTSEPLPILNVPLSGWIFFVACHVINLWVNLITCYTLQGYKVFLVALRNLSPTFVATVPIFFATCWWC